MRETGKARKCGVTLSIRECEALWKLITSGTAQVRRLPHGCILLKGNADWRDADTRITPRPLVRSDPASLQVSFWPAEQQQLLGFVLYPDRRRLKRRKGIHFRQHLIARVQQYQAGEIVLDDLTASVRGWINHVRYANTMGLRKAMLRSIIMTPPREAQHDRK